MLTYRLHTILTRIGTAEPQVKALYRLPEKCTAATPPAVYELDKHP